MRIAIAKSGPMGGDGVSRVIECWARILCESGHETVVVSERADRFPELGDVEHDPVDPAAGGRSTRLFAAARQTARTVAQRVAVSGLDLVISHDSMVTVAIRQALPSIPLLGTFHSPLVDENRLNNWTYARGLGRKLTYPATWAIFWQMERRALKAVNAAHTLSEFTWGHLTARYPGVCSGVRWQRIPGSYDPARFVPTTDRPALRRELGLAEAGTVLLSIRRLVPRNGVDRIVRCARELGNRGDDVVFLIGGTGPLEGELKRQIEQDGLGERVHMLGFVPEDRLAAYYQASDAFLLPTRELECFGLPVIEAMGCGCPSLVMPDGGPAEICRPFPDWIAEANTDEAFTSLVARYVSDGDAWPVAGIDRLAQETYSDAAIRPAVLELAESLGVRERAA